MKRTGFNLIRVGDVLAKVKRPGKLKTSEYMEIGMFPVIDQGDGDVAGYTNDESLVVKEPLPITVFGDHTRRVKLVNEPFVCGADGTQLLYPNTSDIDPYYFYYAVKNIDVANNFYSRHFKFLKDKKINIPRKSQQTNVVDVLLKYDNLIENNKRRIALLEESARLLYREWFVRFRFPGHEHIKIIDGLPEGWTKVKYEDILGKVKKKGKIKKEQYQQDGLFPCIDQSKDFIAGYIDDVELVFSEPLPVLIFGDHTRIVKFIDFPFVQGADGTQILIPKNDEITPVFFYFLTQSIDLANAFYARHFKFLKATEIILPTQNLIKQFEKSVGVNMKQIKTLREMNRKLTQARDILLPRLMNGDLAV